MINVLIVDDSAIIRTILKQVLSDDPRFKVLGEAANGQDAITKAKSIHPDLIIMDINMPVMDGIESTKIIMKECPTNIVIFSTEDSARYGFEAINAGAREMINKPDLSSSSTAFYNDFKEKLYLLGSCKSLIPPKSNNQTPVVPNIQNNSTLIMIGASTGGPLAVQTVLKDLGNDIGVPVMVTQHIDASFAQHYTQWLEHTTEMKVKFADDNEICKAGWVYVAPPDYHMLIDNTADTGLIIRLNQEQSVHFLRPAVDPMFESGATVIGKNCIAILLTGMGRDGADGCVKLKDSGAYTICESEETCAVYGMPKAAIDEGGACAVLPVNKIGEYVRKLLDK